MAGAIWQATVRTAKIALLAAAPTVFEMTIPEAWAGGLYIQEYTTPSMGTADSGSQAWADNAGAAWHNPAGMTRLKGSEIMLGAGVGYGDVKFDPDPGTPAGGGDGGNAGSVAPIGALNGVLKINDRWAAGLNVGGITGAALDYNDGWAGRYQAEEVTLAVLGVFPSLAFEVTDWLSIGGGPVFAYGTLDYQLAAPPPAGNGEVKIEDADDTDIMARVGALVTLSETTRLGILYQSETNLNLDGDVRVQPPGLNFNAELEIILPQYVKVAGYHEINDQWAVLGSLRWEKWSDFDDTPVSVEAGTASIPRNWNDTYGASIGLHYRANEQLLLQAGLGYDTSPVSDGNRTADMPVDRQIRYAVGLQYQLSDRASIGGSVVYIDLGDADIDAQTVSGNYQDNQAVAAAINFAWKF